MTRAVLLQTERENSLYMDCWLPFQDNHVSLPAFLVQQQQQQILRSSIEGGSPARNPFRRWFNGGTRGGSSTDVSSSAAHRQQSQGHLPTQVGRHPPPPCSCLNRASPPSLRPSGSNPRGEGELVLCCDALGRDMTLLWPCGCFSDVPFPLSSDGLCSWRKERIWRRGQRCSCRGPGCMATVRGLSP